MRQRKPDRVIGLYDEGNRCRLKWVENGEKRNLLLPNREEAERLARQLAEPLAPRQKTRLADVLTAWADEKLRAERCKPATIAHQLARMRSFFGSSLAEDVSAITPSAADRLYREAVEIPTARTGKPLSAASHRFYLKTARQVFAWAVLRGYASRNPFVGVRPVGRPRAGKPQLRVEEARRFTDEAIRQFEQNGSSLAIGALMALGMGLRTSEGLHRVVRDLDDGGRWLWVDAGKTANARRQIEVPELLRPYLLRLAAGRAPNEPLFRSPETGQAYRRQSLYRTVVDLCEQAGVPRVCTHSLRGLWATLAIGAGAASHAVAAALGHHSFEITQRHYAQPSAVTNAQTARVADVLGGSRSTAKGPSLEHLLAQLPSDLRAQVASALGQAAQSFQASDAFLNRSEVVRKRSSSTEMEEAPLPPMRTRVPSSGVLSRACPPHVVGWDG